MARTAENVSEIDRNRIVTVTILLLGRVGVENFENYRGRRCAKTAEGAEAMVLMKTVGAAEVMIVMKLAEVTNLA